MAMSLTDFLWKLSLDGGTDEETGESETTGWYALFDWDDDEYPMENVAHDYGASVQAQKDIKDNAGAILSQQSSGIKDVSLWPTCQELLEEWEEITEQTGEPTDPTIQI